MLESIYASKLYITSSSDMKKRIHAAINDPLNAELATQLAKDLDPQYQTPDNLVTEDKQQAIKDKDSEPDNERNTGKESVNDITPESRHSDDIKLPHTSKVPAPGVNIDVDKEDSTAPEAEQLKESTEEPAPAVEEATNISNIQKIVATSFPRDNRIDMKQTSETIKNLLNLNSSTQGVTRVFVKDGELSIVYNDDTNLNNVMNAVVEMLNSSGYTYLEFNRLARSKNSIVFELNFADTNNQLKPASELPKYSETTLEEQTNVTTEESVVK